MVQRTLSDFEAKQSKEVLRRATTPSGAWPTPIERNVTRVGTGQLTVTSTPQQLSYVDRNKVATIITNLSTSVDVFWGTNSGLTTTNGDIIPAGKGNWKAIAGAVVIFVVCASGSTATISWAEAFDDEED